MNECAAALRVVTADQLRAMRSGDVVEVVAALAPYKPYPFSRAPGEPTYVYWPRLGGALALVLPGVKDRYTVPNLEHTPGLADWMTRLAAGPVRVRVIGEVERDKLVAYSIERC